jgi:hypothetical protein
MTPEQRAAIDALFGALDGPLPLVNWPGIVESCRRENERLTVELDRYRAMYGPFRVVPLEKLPRMVSDATRNPNQPEDRHD